jgi:hypothetical protein
MRFPKLPRLRRVLSSLTAFVFMSNLMLFCYFRMSAAVISVVPPEQRGHFIVLFSSNRDVHLSMRTLYYPLIVLVPGPGVTYPNATEFDFIKAQTAILNETFGVPE